MNSLHSICSSLAGRAGWSPLLPSFLCRHGASVTMMIWTPGHPSLALLGTSPLPLMVTGTQWHFSTRGVSPRFKSAVPSPPLGGRCEGLALCWEGRSWLCFLGGNLNVPALGCGCTLWRQSIQGHSSCSLSILSIFSVPVFGRFAKPFQLTLPRPPP